MVTTLDIKARTTRVDSGWLVVLESDGAVSDEIAFQSAYEPKIAVIGNAIVSWSANELAVVVDLSAKHAHRVRCREFIQSVLPLHENTLCVVCDTYVSVIVIGEWHEHIVLDHDEMFVSAIMEGTTLTLTDLQGKVLTVSSL